MTSLIEIIYAMTLAENRITAELPRGLHLVYYAPAGDKPACLIAARHLATPSPTELRVVRDALIAGLDHHTGCVLDHIIDEWTPTTKNDWDGYAITWTTLPGSAAFSHNPDLAHRVRLALERREVRESIRRKKSEDKRRDRRTVPARNPCSRRNPHETHPSLPALPHPSLPAGRLALTFARQHANTRRRTMLTYVTLTQIDDNPFQRRAEYGDLEDLAARIHAKRRDYPDTYGLMQVPIGRIVRHEPLLSATDEPLTRAQAEQLIADHGGLPGAMYRVQLAFGHRRLRAFRILAERYPSQYGQSMPVNVLQLSDEQMLDSVWSENRERRDLSAVEEAELLAEKLERARAEGGNQETVAQAWGLSRPTVANRLRLLDLPAEVQQANRDGRISERQALALLPVAELARRLNGQTVDWNLEKKPEPYGRPIAPAGFLAWALGHPDKTTSDAIRDYTRLVVDHTGRPLSDDLAVFEAGEGEEIVQSTCKGCAYRYNQHCLNRPCHDARWARFQAEIPRLAAALTGLPWSDDETHFPDNRDDAHANRLAYANGPRDGLVIGWRAQGWTHTWLNGSGGFTSRAETQKDWRNGLLLGRIPESDPAAAERKPSPPREHWSRIKHQTRDARKARVERAFVEASAPAVAIIDQLRPLFYLFAPELAKRQQSAEEYIAALVKRYWGGNYLYGSRDAYRDFLSAAGLDPDLVDSDNPDELLCERAAGALEDWYNFRDGNNDRRRTASTELYKVAVLFKERGVSETAGPDDLRELAHWLALAIADAKQILAEREEKARQTEEAAAPAD
jgi:ParB/RepB/Spo0J family partition protein